MDGRTDRQTDRKEQNRTEQNGKNQRVTEQHHNKTEQKRRARYRIGCTAHQRRAVDGKQCDGDQPESLSMRVSCRWLHHGSHKTLKRQQHFHFVIKTGKEQPPGETHLHKARDTSSFKAQHETFHHYPSDSAARGMGGDTSTAQREQTAARHPIGDSQMEASGTIPLISRGASYLVVHQAHKGYGQPRDGCIVVATTALDRCASAARYWGCYVCHIL
jgi:hypothetical protein